MKLHRAIATTAIASLCVIQAACGSIKSKIYDSDNYTSEGRQIKCLKGIPETIDVPTHIKITVVENRFYKGPAMKADGSNTPAKAISEVDNVSIASSALVNKLLEKIAELQIKIATTADMTAADKATIAKLEEELKKTKAQLAEESKYTMAKNVQPTRTLTYEFIKKKELFTVNFKRPASGIGDTKITYGKTSGGQYFESVKQDVTDTTIEDVGALVSQIASVLPKLAAITEAETEAAGKRALLGLHSVPTVVAIEYFDIHQPNLEGRIQEFLDRNINACSPPCQDSIRPAPAPAVPSQVAGRDNAVPAAVLPPEYRGVGVK